MKRSVTNGMLLQLSVAIHVVVYEYDICEQKNHYYLDLSGVGIWSVRMFVLLMHGLYNQSCLILCYKQTHCNCLIVKLRVLPAFPDI